MTVIFDGTVMFTNKVRVWSASLLTGEGTRESLLFSRRLFELSARFSLDWYLAN